MILLWVLAKISISSFNLSSTFSKRSARESSGFLNSRKLMKAAEYFYCFQVFGIPGWNCNAWVFEIASRLCLGSKRKWKYSRISRMLVSLLLFRLGNELTRVYALLNFRVWYCMKFIDGASFWCFTGVSNHMHMVNLECLGWMIPFWMFKGIEKERKSLHSNMVEEFSL